MDLKYAMILKQRPELATHTNIDTKKLTEISQLVASVMGMPVQANKAIVGENAFSHSSGSHQDGVIKCRETYEIIDPAEVGVKSTSIILTARSGRLALAYRAKAIGYDLTKSQLDNSYELFYK